MADLPGANPVIPAGSNLWDVDPKSPLPSASGLPTPAPTANDPVVGGTAAGSSAVPLPPASLSPLPPTATPLPALPTSPIPAPVTPAPVLPSLPPTNPTPVPVPTPVTGSQPVPVPTTLPSPAPTIPVVPAADTNVTPAPVAEPTSTPVETPPSSEVLTPTNPWMTNIPSAEDNALPSLPPSSLEPVDSPAVGDAMPTPVAVDTPQVGSTLPAPKPSSEIDWDAGSDESLTTAGQGPAPTPELVNPWVSTAPSTPAPSATPASTNVFPTGPLAGPITSPASAPASPLPSFGGVGESSTQPAAASTLADLFPEVASQMPVSNIPTPGSDVAPTFPTAVVTPSDTPAKPKASSSLPKINLSFLNGLLPKSKAKTATAKPVVAESAAAVTPRSGLTDPLGSIASPVVPPPHGPISAKTKRSLSLVIIFILLLLVIGLSMTILYFLTRGPVQVTIDSGKSTSTSSQLVTTSSTASASSSAASGATTIYGYFVALAADFPNGLPTEEMSAGTVSFGQDYIVKVVMKENVAAADPLQEALDTLLAVKQSTYGEQEYRNLLANSTLTAVITDKETNGTTSKQIDLQGEVVASSTSDYTYIKQQLERTVEVYTFNYSLLLNGSSLAYRCLGDPSCV